MNILRMTLCFFIFLCSCSAPEPQRKTLKIATADDPQSLDPRLVRLLPDVSAVRMLFEGLIRTNSEGVNEPAAAERFSISDDKKTYTFVLRDGHWSDGSPVTARDFAETWKSVLSPSFPAPNAYQLYLIKGAKEAKEGKTSIDAVGISTPDDKTLVVELEEPSPYFIEMVACHFYFPVHESVRNSPPVKQQQKPIGNGPFVLDRWKQRSEVVTVKNPHYWDADKIKTEGISLVVLDENTALKLFEAGSIDWAGSPLSVLPQDAIASLKEKGILQISPGAGTHWFRLNTDKAPFDDIKIRQAFSMTLDRESIVDHITQGGQTPAYGVIPPSFGVHHEKKDVGEFKADIGKLPPIVLSYAANDRNHKIAQAVQQQWSQALGVKIILEASEVACLVQKISKGAYQIALGSWYADIRDPINFLEIFKEKSNPTNQTFWHNDAYTKLLDESSVELDPVRRQHLLDKAEAILIDETPVAPLFHSSYNYLKKDTVNGVYFSPLGFLDFKEASEQQ